MVPALIAIAIFIIWKFVILPRIKQHPQQRKVSFILIITILLSLIMSLLMFFFSENRKKTRYYVPAQIIDGEIKPATTH